MAAGPVAQEDQAAAALRIGGQPVDEPPVAEGDRDQRHIGDRDDAAAGLQVGHTRELDDEGQEQRAQQGAQQGDRMETRIVEAHHVGAGPVAIDQVDGKDQGGERSEQWGDDPVLTTRDSPGKPQQVENDHQENKVQAQQGEEGLLRAVHGGEQG